MKTNKFNGTLLKKLRLSKKNKKNEKMTWLDLAKALRAYEPKISKGSVWGWECGKHEPSARYLSVLSNYFNVPIEQFLKK